MKSIIFQLFALLLFITAFPIHAGLQGAVLPEAWDAMNSNSQVAVTDRWDYIRFRPRSGIERQDTCFIFYPGGLVSPHAYAPYGQAIAAQGYYSYILKVPLGLAILAPNAANSAKADFYANKYCANFVIAGHSLGGTVAAQYVDSNPADGLVMLAAYPESSRDLTYLTTPVASVYGTNDCQTTVNDIQDSMANLPAHTNFVEIVGGNHPQFGWYEDNTTGDCAATISLEGQTDISIQTILSVLTQMGN